MRRSGTIEIDGAVVEAHHLWYVREELRLYPERKRALAERQREIATETPVIETPGIQAGPSNPTMGRATALMADRDCAWLEERINWIEKEWRRLDPVTRLALDLLVTKATHTAAGAADVIRVKFNFETFSEASVYRHLNRGLLQLALAFWDDRIIVKGKRPKNKVRKLTKKSAEVRVSGGSNEVKSL